MLKSSWQRYNICTIFWIWNWCGFLKLSKCSPNRIFSNVSPNAFGLLSEWFQYAFRIDRILSAWWLRKVSFPNASVCFPNDFRIRRIEVAYNRTLFRDVGLSVALHRFWQVRSKETYGRSFHIYWNFVDRSGILKGFVMFYVYFGYSKRIRTILEVYEQFEKCSERILKSGKDTGNDRKAFVMF